VETKLKTWLGGSSEVGQVFLVKLTSWLKGLVHEKINNMTFAKNGTTIYNYNQ
jgi:hypothetical protein